MMLPCIKLGKLRFSGFGINVAHSARVTYCSHAPSLSRTTRFIIYRSHAFLATYILIGMTGHYIIAAPRPSFDLPIARGKLSVPWVPGWI